MKTIYLTLFVYDRSEQLSVYSVSDTYEEGKTNWKKDLCHFLGYGPDDVSRLYFCKAILDDDVVEQLKNHTQFSELEEYEFLKQYIDPILYTNECRVLTDCTGGDFYEMIETYGEIKGLPKSQVRKLTNDLENGTLDNDVWDEICQVYSDNYFIGSDV